MKKISELRKTITAALKTVHPRVYYEDAEEGAAYPYLVYNLSDSIHDGTLEQFVLDVDGWDDKPDTTALENMMDEAHNALQGLAVPVDDEMVFIFWLDNRRSLRDENPSLRRRQYTYAVRTYERRIIHV